MDEAARTTVWRTVTDEAAGRGSGGRCFRRIHRTAALVIVSAGKSVRTAVGDVVVDEAAGKRWSGSIRTAAGCVALWKRPRWQKEGEQGPAAVNRRDGCRQVATDEVAGARER